jgi:hypothetical protein
MSCGSHKSLRFPRSMLQLLVIANVVPSSLILFTLMMEAIHSSETSVATLVTRRHIPEYVILHSHRHKISDLTLIDPMF